MRIETLAGPRATSTPRGLFALHLVLAGVVAACTPGGVKDPSKVGARFENSEKLIFAYELKPACRLQMYDGPGQPPAKAWANVESGKIANRPFAILERKTTFPSDGMASLVAQTYKLQGAGGEVIWVRNVPEASSEKAAADWQCAFDQAAVAKVMPKLEAPVVRLSAASTECTGFAPIFGGVEGVTFAPYTVTGRSLFVKDGKGVVGIRLEADGGEKAITVPGNALDQCFVAADRVPPSPREATSLRNWLSQKSLEVVPPPPVSRDTVEQLTALQLDRCMVEGTGVLTHHECRMPILRIADTKQKGPYGPTIIRFVRERVTDAVHLYAGHLVPPADIVTANVAVRLGKGSGEAFGRTFNDALEKSMIDGPKRLRRAAEGFRLLRLADISAGVPATHYVNIELTFSVPEVSETTERRVHKYVAGKKKIHNAKFDEAKTELSNATEALESAKRAAAFIEEGTKIAAEQAGKACKDAGNKAGGAFGGLLGSALCSSATNAAGGAAERAALKSAEDRFATAQSRLASTAETIDVDDTQDYAYDAKVYRRRGDAVARISILGAGQTQAQAVTSANVHFEASDDEVQASPEHRLAGKAAKVPTSNDVERELSTNLIQRIDEAIVRWGAQRQVGGDIGDLQPGTRSWMVAVARHAASDRNVKLLSDLLETRGEALGKAFVDYPVKMPKKLDKRCFTFAAIPLDPKVDVNLTLGVVEGNSFTPVVLDQRPVAEAGFEVCDLPENTQFAARVFQKGGAEAKKAANDHAGVLVSMFESTPGSATATDTITASRGIPTMARKGEELALNGEGVVEFRGTNNQVVVGRTGDRDGDGVADDEDRCPYDPETRNGYLDDDGCPDVPPAGFKSPTDTAGATPAPAGGHGEPPPPAAKASGEGAR